MKNKKQKEEKAKLVDYIGQHPPLMGHKRAWPFARNKELTSGLLQKVRQKNAFEETKRTKLK